MKIIQNDRTYQKEDRSTKRSIDRGIMKLSEKLAVYFENHMTIETIFNDDILIHDIINKRFYVYKCQVDKIQLRILYMVQGDALIIVSHYCKKKSTKEYISYFEKISHTYENQR
ncbi:MAG: hypothetical protein V3G42_08485 [Oscillospiraceae bacterium]